MKRFFKILGITVLSVIVILYLSFLFVLPNAININEYKADIQKLVKEQSNLTLDFDNAKISVTPWLEAGLATDNFKIKLPDESELLSAESFKGRISLPHLLLLTVRVSTAQITNPVINVDIVNGKAFKAVQAFEEILNTKEEKIEETIQTAQKPIIDPASIKIVVPALTITNFKVLINDLKTANFLKLQGNKLVVGYNNGQSVSLKTDAELYVNDTKNINANIDIDTFIPQQSKLDNEDDKAQRVEIPFINPVAMYMAYDLKTNVESKIKVRQHNNTIVSKGYFNIDNFTLILDGIQLPESKLHLNSKGTKINLDTDLYLTDEEKISLLGMLNYGKKPAADIKITSNEIHLDNVIMLIKAMLNSLHIKHELDSIRGEGYFIADTYLNTNFKKLNSNGNITIKDCIVKNTATKQQLAKVNSIISLDNNMLKFVDTSAEIAQTIFKIDGSIDDKSIADISILMEKMPLQKVFTLFLPKEINNVYNVNSGSIDLKATLTGELKKAVADAQISLQNLSLTDKINKINYMDNILVADFTSNFKSFTGNIKNSDFKLAMNGASVNCETFNLSIGEKDITIEPAEVKINNSSVITFNGDIKSYLKNPEFNFDLKGNLVTNDLKQLLGKDLEIFINNKGSIPVVASIIGNSKKQTLTASIEADKDNFITPLNIKNVENKKTILKAVVDFKGDRLKIKDTGFYIKNVAKDPENPEKEIITYDEIVGVDGTITKLNTSNPNINLIKVKMPNELSANICAFPQSKLKALGHMFIFGDLKAPRIRGDFNIYDMEIPELYITMARAASTFEGKNLDINVKDLIANGSDFNAIINADLNPSKNFTIKNLDLISNMTDADKLMQVSDAAMKLMPASTQTNGAQSNIQSADIPVVIKAGTIDMKHIKSGTINLYETTGKISLANNIFYINNLLASAFEGKIKGDVSMNLVTTEIKANVKGENLDVEKTLLDAAEMKDTLTGTMDFTADIGLRGSTYEEQMKTLKGKVNFEMKNGSLGPFGKLENLILAENIRESAFFKSTIGTVLNSLLSFDTTKYNTLNGSLTFSDGITQINPIESSGDIMATYIFGDFDLLKNKIDIKLRGRLGSQVSNSMGPLALLNPINLVKATPGMSLVLGKVFFLFTETVTESEYAQIPALGKDIDDINATKFQVIVRGDVAKPLTLVKSFKWLALQSDIDAASAHIDTLPENTKIPEEYLNMTTMSKEEIKTEAKKKVTETVKNAVSEETKQQIERTKETANKLKTMFSNKETNKQTLKENAEQTKQNVLNRLKEQAKAALTVPVETTDTTETTDSAHTSEQKIETETLEIAE